MAALVEGAARRLSREEAEERATRAREPLCGAFVGVAIGALLILTVEPIKALLFVIFILILQQIEGNLIYPKIVGKAVGLPGVIVLSAVLVGGNIAGIIGGLCAVPVSAVLYTLLRGAVDSRLERRQGPRSGDL